LDFEYILDHNPLQRMQSVFANSRNLRTHKLISHFLLIQIFLCAGEFFWLFVAFSCFRYGDDFVLAWKYIKEKAQQISLKNKQGKIKKSEKT